VAAGRVFSNAPKNNPSWTEFALALIMQARDDIVPIKSEDCSWSRIDAFHHQHESNRVIFTCLALLMELSSLLAIRQKGCNMSHCPGSCMAWSNHHNNDRDIILWLSMNTVRFQSGTCTDMASARQ
jgi:hypothetical protein